MQSSELIATLDDARYLAPALGSGVTAALLKLHLDDLAERIEAGNSAGARRALAGARRSLGTGRSGSEQIATTAVRLVLDQAEALLERLEWGGGAAESR